jgi:hypothetical protein
MDKLSTARKFGKLPAVHDPRIPALSDRMTLEVLPPPPTSCNWFSELTTIQMLGNDQYGCCVEAATYHLVAKDYQYMKGVNIGATTAQCLQTYSDVTGFNAAVPSSDQGTVMQGPGGMLEYWAKNGISIGRVLNKVGPYVTVNFNDMVQVRTAIDLFQAVMTGATMTESVMTQELWNNPTGPVVGGHEFLIVGYAPDPTTGLNVYDIETWGGMYKATEEWLTASVDEMIVVFNTAMFNAQWLNSAGVSEAQLKADLALIVNS